MSDKYEINVISPQGKLVKKITKRCQSRKLTKKDIEKVARPSSRREYIIPEHMPYIADFFVLDNKYLLVITFENDYDAKTLAGDLFDEDGNFQTCIAVPKYWSWYSLFNALKNQALYKNNHFYTIETDDKEVNFYVKRYKMIWEDK